MAKELKKQNKTNTKNQLWEIPADLQAKGGRDLGATERSTAVLRPLVGF